MKLQNLFRKELALQSVESKLESQKEKLARRATCDFPEGDALTDFVTQLKAKKITPEAFFRLCDVNYTRNVPKEQFARTMETLGIKLTSTQTKRLLLLFDENLSNTISLEEYQNALEAFNVGQEQHILSNDPQKAHKSFELQALEKYFAVLEQRRMQPEELFASVCSDPNGSLNLNQMRDFILSIKPSMQVKELQAIKNFYDVDRNGEITRTEFIQADARAKKSVTIRKQQEEAGEFDILNTVQADQSAAPMANGRDERIATIIASMDKSGIPFYMFYDALAKSSAKSTINMSSFAKAMDIYPKLREADRDYLSSLVQTPDRLAVKVSELKKINDMYANKKQKLNVEAHLSYIANSIVRGVRAAPGGKQDAEASSCVKFGIRKELERIGATGLNITKAKALEFFSQISLGGLSDLEAVLKTFKSYDGRNVMTQEMTKSLQMYAVSSFTSKKPIDGKEAIPNYQFMEPREKTNAAISYVVTSLQKKGLEPISAYRMADTQNTGKVKGDDLIRRFIKLDPSLDNGLVSQAVSSFGNKNTLINQKMFELEFKLQSGSSKATRPQTAKPTSGNEIPQLVRKLDNIMMNEGIAPLTAFKKADYNSDGFIDIQELKKVLANLLPNDSVTNNELSQVMAVFDINLDQKIDQREFLAVFERARANLPAATGPDGSDFGDEEIEAGDQSAAPMNLAFSAGIPAQPQARKKSVIGASMGTAKAVNETKLPTDPKKLIKLIEENYLTERIETYFDDLLENDVAKVTTIHLRMDKNKGSNGIPLNLVEFFCHQVMGSNTKNVKMSSVVKYIQAGKGKYCFNLVAFCAKLKHIIGTPFKQNLADVLQGEEDGLTIEECFESFKTNATLSRWEVACFFYAILGNDSKGLGVIQLDDMVNVVENASDFLAQQQQPTQNSFTNNANDQVEEKADQSAPMRQQPQSIPATRKRQSEATEMENELTAEMRDKLSAECIANVIVKSPNQSLGDKIDGYWGTSLRVTDDLILKVYRGYIEGTEMIKSPALVASVINKLDAWADNLEGNNYEAREKAFAKGFTQIKKENTHIKELDLLAFRKVLKDINVKDKVGLTSWELLVAYIMFASHEDMNDLILDQSFLLTSNRNLQEDDENDREQKAQFINLCFRRVKASMYIIKCIIGDNEIRIKSGKPPLKITDSKVFSEVRFAKIAHKLRHELTTPQQKAKFLKHFQQAKDNQLTYFDFFRVLEEHNIQVGGPDCPDQKCIQNKTTCESCFKKMWLRDSFTSYLDDYGDAHISLDNIIEFLQAFGVDIGAKQGKIMSLEAKQRKEAEISPAQYKISPQKDYFRGCKTILNSAVAAICVAEKLYADCKSSKKKFFDVDFGPKNENDEQGSIDAIYFPGERTKALPNHDQICWMRPDEFIEKAEGPGQFLSEDAGANDVCQGQIGDCWFIGAMSVLATRDELVYGGAAAAGSLVHPGMIVDRDMSEKFCQGVYAPIFHKFRTENIYVLRFFKEFAWRYVIIDDRLPCFKANQSLVFAKCQDKKELWVPLIEKAYAKLFGCYQTLISGFIDDGLHDMTSFVNEKLKLHDKSGFFPEDQAEEFWNKLCNARADGSLMGCSNSGATEREVLIDGERCGIMSGHAYGLNDVIDIWDGPEGSKDRNNHRLLRVRNPWGRVEWNGPWSDYSEEIEEHKKMILKYVAELEDDEKFELQADDGTFLIDYQNFRDVYNRLFIAIDFPVHWNGIRFFSKWTPEYCGGLPLEGTEAAMIRFAKNPQYQFAPKRDCELFVSLAQPDGRIKGSDGSYDIFPFKTRIHTAMLMLVELDPGQSIMERYESRQVKKTEKPTVLHELSMRWQCKAGKKYVLVPAPKMPNTTGDFFLSMYFDCEMYNVDIKRLNGPPEQFKFIPEEYEKMSKRVPQWRVDYCEQSIPHMLGQRDISKGLKSLGVSSVMRKKTIKK